MTDTNHTTTRVVDDYEIHNLLREQRKIAVIWCMEDVQHVRPDLDDEQAWEVLEYAGSHHDADLGISWATLEILADELCPFSGNE